MPVAGGAYGGSNYVLNENGALLRYGADPAYYLTDVLAARARRFVRESAAAGTSRSSSTSLLSPRTEPARPAARHARLFRQLKAPRTPSFDEEDVSDKPARMRNLAPLSPAEIEALDELYRKPPALAPGGGRGDRRSGRGRSAPRGSSTTPTSCSPRTTASTWGSTGCGRRSTPPTRADVRVPLLVRGPGVPARRVVPALTSSIDLAPTIAELADTELHHTADGRSLVRLLHGAPTPAGWRKVVFLEQFESVEPATGESGVLEPSDPAHAAAGATIFRHLGLRGPGFKYIASSPRFEEYYDLAADPDETDNRIDRLPEAYRGRLAALAQKLSRCAGAGCRQLESAALPAPP